MWRVLIGLLTAFVSTLGFGSYPDSENFTSNAISNEYIVVLKPDFNTQSFSMHVNETVLKRFPNLNGMLVETEDPRTLQQREGVAYVEPNTRMHILTDQSGATWGLDRIDSRAGLDAIYKYSATGQGVNVYVIDTGVYAHNELSGRLAAGYSAIDGGSTVDCNGHGTHVSGTIAGATYGVAKRATVYPVRVLDCEGSGSTSDVIEGIEWVASNARRPAVANMSLGGSRMQSINDAVSKAVAKGVVFVVAAGNSSDDSCRYSPASTPEAITVAASDKSDVSAPFTSYGSCVDVYAPGVGITSAGISSPSSSATMSGTSMASPHTAGAVALLLEKNPSASPAAITSQLLNNATRGPISSVPASTPNLLIYTNPQSGGGDPTPTPTPPPSPDAGVPSECSNAAWMCSTVTGNLNPTTYYEQQPKEPMAINYPRPLKIYVKGNADLDLYLYRSADGGQTWAEVARANSVGTTESMTYQANAKGLYVWIVMLKTSGTNGTYNAWIVK
jgi:subtilisin family serine protease